MSENSEITAAEAAFVLEVAPETVKKSLDQGPVEAKLVRRKGIQFRTLDRIDVIFLYASRLLKDDLTAKARAELYQAMKQHPKDMSADFGRYRVDLSDAIREVDRRLDQLDKVKHQVEIGENEEALIRGTRIEAHRIAALLDGGMTVEQVLEDYPSLGRDQVEAAQAYAAAHPKAGRPYPPTTFKRMLRNSGLHQLDEVLEDEDSSAQERQA